MNINKLAFFGASVTKQNNSYADMVAKFWPSSCEYKKFGYGSMHISDAGICFIDDVINYKPDICFIDWFSTSKTDYGDSIVIYLDTIINKLVTNNIIPILLLFPISVMLDTRLYLYSVIKTYAQNYNILCIDIFNKCLEHKIDTHKLIKDYVHTTDIGAEYYSTTILEYLQNQSLHLPNKPIHMHKYSNIYRTLFDMHVTKFITLELFDELIGIYQTIGPYSDGVDVYKGDTLIEQRDIWDVWCHYERDTIKIGIPNPGIYTLKLKTNSIDKYKYNNKIDWSVYTKNIVKIKQFFYTANMRVIDYE